MKTINNEENISKYLKIEIFIRIFIWIESFSKQAVDIVLKFIIIHFHLFELR